MELEFHQLDLRYESLRVRSPKHERALAASVADVGQLVPIAVVAAAEAGDHFVVVDGFKRIRARRKLGHDVVLALLWDLGEVEALLLHRAVRAGEGESALEQAWLLDELHRRFDLTMDELARRFERTTSWVSRRLALVRELPDAVQDEIREGRVAPHAAAKFLVPVARANPDQCQRMAHAIGQHGLSTREVGEVYAGWRDGSHASRERIVADPQLFLRAQRALRDTPEDALGPREGLLRDVPALGAIARRARQRAVDCMGELTPLDHERILAGLRVAGCEIQALVEFLHDIQGAGHHAGPEHEGRDPGAEVARPVA